MLPTLFFKSILAIFYGSLWIHYLHKLTDPDSTPRRCREVAPVLRSVLTVIAWVGVVLGVLVVWAEVEMTVEEAMSVVMVDEMRAAMEVTQRPGCCVLGKRQR